MTHRDFFDGSTLTPASKYTINELFCLPDYFVVMAATLGFVLSFFLRNEEHDVKLTILLAQNLDCRILLLLIYA
jgi:hypothetical protein